MQFLINEEYNVIFGWSPKCGCSHIKRIFYYLKTDNINNVIHTIHDKQSLPSNFLEYHLILFIRNPYERLISGFIDKYRVGHIYHSLWNTKMPLTFTNFTRKLVESDWKLVEKTHFTPQLDTRLIYQLDEHTEKIIYDIKNIDYAYIEKLFDKKIPEELLDFRGFQHKSLEPIDYPVYDLLIEKYYHFKPFTRCYYNNSIKSRIDKFFFNDFMSFKRYGFNYTIE